jgi:hypothetical protein
LLHFEAKITKSKRSEKFKTKKSKKMRKIAKKCEKMRKIAKKWKKVRKKSKINRLEIRFALFRFEAKITQVRRSEKLEANISEKTQKKRSEIVKHM